MESDTSTTPSIPVTIRTCGDCARSSPAVEYFSIGLSGSGALCPECSENQRSARIKWSLVLDTIAIAAGLSLFIARPETPLGIFLTVFAFVLPFVWIATLFHELGHALIARLMGTQVFLIKIGSGSEIAAHTRFGYEIFFGRIPFGGITLIGPADGSALNWRLRKSISTAAGPAANLLLAAITWALVFDGGGLRSWARAAEGSIVSLLVPLALMWALINLIMFIANLWPFLRKSDQQIVPSDGLAIFNALSGRSDYNKHWLEARHAAIQKALRLNELQIANTLCDDALVRYPQNSAFKVARTQILIHMGRAKEAAQECRNLLVSGELSLVTRAVTINNLAHACLMLHEPDDLRQADELSENAEAALFWSPGISGTRGMALIANGRASEGIPRIKKSMKYMLDAKSKAEGHAFLAVGHFQQGDTQEAARYFELSKAYDPECFFLAYASKVTGLN